MKSILIGALCCFSFFSQAQDHEFEWWDPMQSPFQVVEGQAWGSESNGDYHRLPKRADGLVRESVYSLGTQSAGLMIRFRTNARSIKVKYQIEKGHNIALHHMPATGVSGLDLYAIDSEGKELWCAARRSYQDTISYHFNDIESKTNYHELGNEYRLYLPLYSKVEWLKIGVNAHSHFEALPIRNERPIVVYGTSIAQGACASRPGMAWTAILGRKFDRPLINLGFSGTGLLDIPVIDLMAEIDAKIFILDCMPNLTNRGHTDKELKDLIINATKRLKAKRPEIPVLLVAHAGYTHGLTNPTIQTAYERVNLIQSDAFFELKKEGVDGLYYLSHTDINLQQDDMVDGVHPTDLGMVHYADSYELKLRDILREPVGKSTTTIPMTQYREPLNYDWEKRHREILDLNKSNPPKTIMIANSIIHFWGGQPKAKIVRDGASWESVLTPAGVRNYAYGWDRIENVLWRVYHGELDGFEAEKILLMIGTNNLHLNTNEEIVEGLALLVKAIQHRQPTAEIVLMGILPRRDYEERIVELNFEIARIAGRQDIQYADLGIVFLEENKLVNESLFSDGLHPNKAGYEKLIQVLGPLVE